MMKIRCRNKDYGGPTYYCFGINRYIRMREIWKMMRDGIDFEYEGVHEIDALNILLKQAEHSFPRKGHIVFTSEKNDIGLLNRIIRNGGFANYIEKLETAQPLQREE